MDLYISIYFIRIAHVDPYIDDFVYISKEQRPHISFLFTLIDFVMRLNTNILIKLIRTIITKTKKTGCYRYKYIDETLTFILFSL